MQKLMLHPLQHPFWAEFVQIMNAKGIHINMISLDESCDSDRSRLLAQEQTNMT